MNASTAASERELDRLLGDALTLADRAGRATLGRFRTGVAAEWKADDTPVTIADREAETLIRDGISRLYPSHAVVGEEFGASDGSAPYRWWIDPIDGTKAFLCGVPTYGVLIGIEREGDVIAGVAAFPALGETIAARSGGGCRLNGVPCRVSDVGRLDRAVVSTTDTGTFLTSGRAQGWRRLADAAWVRAGWGDAYGYALVASGRIEAMVDPALAPHDAGPLPVLLEEAGGFFGAWNGQVTLHGGNGVGVNASLKDEVLRLLGDAPGDRAEA